MSLTPQGRSPADLPPDERAYDDPDAAQGVPDGGGDDALRQAAAERLQRYELERAADEGMAEPVDSADEDPDIA